MKARILFLGICFILLLGSASAVYELCDSVERISDTNKVTFICNITTSQIVFTQQDIDSFWEKILADGDYTHDRLEAVEWKIKSAVINVSDDLRFIEPEGMNIIWDLTLTGDTNTFHDFNQAIATPLRTTNQTAIKQRIGGLQNYFISIAPLGNRKSVRNITLERPDDAFAVHISGSAVKEMEIDIEGTLSLSSSFIENVSSLKAMNITLSNGGYLQNIGSIKAENISIEDGSYIRGVGSFDEIAIKIENGQTGIIIKDNSYIENLKGYIESDSDIYLEEKSSIKNLSYAPSETIQLIQADNLTLKDGSSITGLGGKPGQIILNGTLKLENSKIFGRENNKPSGIKVNAISMSDNSLLQKFLGDIEVKGKETFVLESGSVIGEILGIINSCAKLSMDGNTTKIRFLKESSKEVKAKGIDLNNEAKIECIGDADCNYFYIYQTCDSEPNTNLEVETQSGNVPFTVEFTGGCDTEGSPVTCTIDFGDGSEPELFDTNTTHIYLTSGSFNAVLTAKTSEMSSISEKTIVVVEAGVLPPTIGGTQAALSVQNIARGEEINIILQCEDKIGLLSIENNLGIPSISAPPEQCPAILGPFKIPETTEPGNYSFTISGLTENGTAFEQTLTFTVETSQMIPELPVELDSFMIFGIAGIVGIVIVIVILVIFIKKKKGGLKKPKEKNNKKRGEITDKEMAAAAKELSQGQQQTQEGVKKPPWMVEETENEIEKTEKKSETIKPEEKNTAEAKQETKSAEKNLTWMKKPGEKPTQTEVTKEKTGGKKGGLFGFLKRKKKPAIAKEPEGIQKPMKMQTQTKAIEPKTEEKKPIETEKPIETKQPTKPIEAEKSIETTKPTEPAQTAEPIRQVQKIKPSKDTESLEKEIEILKAEKTDEELYPIKAQKIMQEKPSIPKVIPIKVVKPSNENRIEEKANDAPIEPKTVQVNPKDSEKRFENLVELVKGTDGNVSENTVEKKKPAEIKKSVEIEKPAEIKKPVFEMEKSQGSEKKQQTKEKQVVDEKKGFEEQNSAWFKRKKKPAEKKEEQSDVPQWLKKN